jgi:[protein-PII] uridylyltransferase
MGYHDRERRDGDNTPAVERFMRRYFLIAKEVGILTRAYSAKLEAEHLKQAPRGLLRFFPARGRKPPVVEPGFVREGGRLSVISPSIFDEDPVNLLRLFRIADGHDLDLHPDALTAAARRLSLITSKVRRDPAAARVFLDVLAHGRNPRRSLELMNEAGVLGRYIPEFGRVVAQMQFNMYHSYTVDEHTLRAVGIIADIAEGRLAEDHPLSAFVMPLIEDREALFLAMLLHDTGKGGHGGQGPAGARAARQACERLGLERHRIDLIAWLVRHHLEMSDYAQKRDLGDPATIAAFARLVETPERLRMLLVLTVADIRAVGPGVWNGWKGQLLRELYNAAEATFRGGRIADAAGVVRRRQQALAYDARGVLAAATPAAKAWASAMEDAYFVAFSESEHRAHAALSARARATGGAAAQAEVREGRNATEIVVAAPDRRALFADLALALSAAGANVVGARIFTSASGEALDVFFIQNAAGEPFGGDSPRTLARLLQALERAGREEPSPSPAEGRRLFLKPSPFTIASSVALDNDASEAATVIEASGRDRPGLLEALARALSDAGLSIQSAHIDGHGERAVDTFYVVEPDATKLVGDTRMAEIKARLSEILDAEPAERASRLPRARASQAR